MTFKVGDRVRIITKEYEGNEVGKHFGETGKIGSCWGQSGGRGRWHVIRLDRATILYNQEDLELEGSRAMAPEESLEEIEQAQLVYSRLQAS